MQQTGARCGAARETLAALSAAERKAKRAVKLRRAGWRQNDIARQLGVSDARVSQYLKANGEPGRRRGPVKGVSNKKERRVVAKMWPQRLVGEITTQDIANAIGRSISTVTRIATDLGFDVPLGRQPTYPRQGPQPCKCGCGKMVDPIPALAVRDLGGYVGRSHFERAHKAAKAELANQRIWLTVALAAKILAVTDQAVRQYGEQGRLTFTHLEDIPELQHLTVLETKWLVRRSDVERLRKGLLIRYGNGVGPPARLYAVYGQDAQRRWAGKLAKATAEANGKQVGLPPIVERGNADEREILERFRRGESQLKIADAMSLTREKVRTVLRRNNLAA